MNLRDGGTRFASTTAASTMNASRQKVLPRLLIAGVLICAIAIVIVDQALRPCETVDVLNTSLLCSRAEGCRQPEACAAVHTEAFIGWVAENPGAGSVLLAFVVAVAVVFFVPGSVLTLGAGAAFGAALGVGWGVVVGTIAVWVGAAVGGLTAFTLGRLVLHQLVNRLLHRWRWAVLHARRERVAAHVHLSACMCARRLSAALDAALREEGLRLMVPRHVLLTRSRTHAPTLFYMCATCAHVSSCAGAAAPLAAHSL